jgi:signal transduction histidine kinase
VEVARRDLAAAQTVAATEQGKRRVDAIRAEFDRFMETERVLAVARQRSSDAAARRAIVAAAGGLGGSILLVLLFAGYLTRAIVQPVRRAAAMAGRLAGGDLGVRMTERGVGEIGVLERSFNTMAGSLERSREELAASRTRIVAAGDQARRRIERDLHDGTQQRLVSLVLDLRAAEAAVPPELPGLRAQLAGVADGLAGALDELRELSRGIHPAILSEGGLGPALKALARRSAVPVELEMDVPVELEMDVPSRLPEPVEVAAYYVVSEALTNAAKHARASLAHVQAQTRDGHLHLSVRDDGVGGAAPGRGSGLVGLTDRVEALGGTVAVHSPPRAGHQPAGRHPDRHRRPRFRPGLSDEAAACAKPPLTGHRTASTARTAIATAAAHHELREQPGPVRSQHRAGAAQQQDQQQQRRRATPSSPPAPIRAPGGRSLSVPASRYPQTGAGTDAIGTVPSAVSGGNGGRPIAEEERKEEVKFDAAMDPAAGLGRADRGPVRGTVADLGQHHRRA